MDQNFMTQFSFDHLLMLNWFLKTQHKQIFELQNFCMVLTRTKNSMTFQSWLHFLQVEKCNFQKVISTWKDRKMQLIAQIFFASGQLRSSRVSGNSRFLSYLLPVVATTKINPKTILTIVWTGRPCNTTNGFSRRYKISASKLRLETFQLLLTPIFFCIYRYQFNQIQWGQPMTRRPLVSMSRRK